MGCFDYRCCVTGLPIRAGDSVKFVLLTENPYEDNNTIIYMHDYWFLRTWPLRAEYNDYGSIEGFDGTSPGVWAVVEGLKKDLVEVGTGDNSVHDAPTKKGMSFSDTLNAVQEGRMLVARDYDYNKELHLKIDTEFQRTLPSRSPIFSKVYEPPEGLPTLQRITTLLESKGFKISGMRDYDDDSYLVDELDHGWIRIRQGGFGGGKAESLTVLLPILREEKYAAMITAGSGNYANEAEIQVMPLPGSRMAFRRSDSKTPLKVCQGMILSSAWDAILRQTNYQKIRAGVQAEWEKSVKPCSNLEVLVRGMARGDDGAAALFHRSEVPFTMGLGEHMSLILDRHNQQPFTDQQIKDFLDDVAGLECLYHIIMPLRYWWKPSWHGGQGSDYRKDQQWHTMLAEVCEQLQQTLDIDRAKWDTESEIGDEQPL